MLITNNVKSFTVLFLQMQQAPCSQTFQNQDQAQVKKSFTVDSFKNLL